MPEHHSPVFAFEEQTKKIRILDEEFGNRYRALGNIYAKCKAALKKDLFFFAMCPEDGPFATSKVFDAQLAGMEAAAAQLAAKVQVVDHLWSTGYIRKSGECQADELLIKGENELARAQANIDDLEKMNRKLARSLAESSTTPPAANKVPFVTTPPASIPQATTPSVTTLLTNNPPATTPSGPLAAKPTITTAVPFGDEVLQHEVSKVDWAAVPWGKELLVSKDKLPLMGSNDAIVNRPEALTPVSFGDDLLRNAMSEVTSTVKLPKQRDAEPVSASFTLPLLNPTTSTTLMLSTVDKASTGNVEVTSVLSMPKRNADDPMSTDPSTGALPTLEKASTGGSKDGADFAPITPDVEAASSSRFVPGVAAASPAVDSTPAHPSPPLPDVKGANPLPTSPLCHEPISCPEKWAATWNAYSPVPEIWGMGCESMRVTVRRGPGQAFQDTQAKKAAQRLLAQQAHQAYNSFKRRMIRRLTGILNPNVGEAKRLFCQLQRESDERVRGACQHSFGQVPGAIKALNSFVRDYVRERVEKPEPAGVNGTASRAR